jgi:RHS repeat-associated protein
VSGARTFAYYFENRLKSMTASGSTVTVVYDGDGNRVAKTVGGVTTRYLVDDLNPTDYSQVVEELTGSSVTRTYSYGLQRINENQLVSGTWTPSFYGYDGFGSVRTLSNAVGAITDTYEYDAWGNSFGSVGSTPNLYLYRGEQYDPDLMLYYLRARYFNPQTGRFLSTDPWQGSPEDPTSLHRYVYAGMDPVNSSDPSGGVNLATRGLTTAIVSITFGATDNVLGYAAAAGVGAAIGPSIACIWQTGGSWLGVGELVAQGRLVNQVVRTRCGLKPEARKRTDVPPATQPCWEGLGNCVPWAKKNRKPGEKYIIYTTTNPAPTCRDFMGERIFVTQFGGAPTYNHIHWGVLDSTGQIVRDSIYPGGVPRSFWQGGAYKVASECMPPGIVVSEEVTFEEAVKRGIGTIVVE